MNYNVEKAFVIQDDTLPGLIHNDVWDQSFQIQTLPYLTEMMTVRNLTFAFVSKSRNDVEASL